MGVYLLLFLFVIFCASQYDASKANFWLIFIFLAMTLVAGLRDVEVGTDSYNYYFQFRDKDVFSQLNIFKDLTHEVGFDILLGISQKLWTNYASLFLLIAAVVYSISILAIKKNTDSMMVSMFVYMGLCCSAFCYNGARQGIAIAIYMFSLQYLLSGNFKKYCLIVLIAALFHKTVIVSIPLYYLFRRGYSTSTMGYTIVFAAILTFLMPYLLSYASTLEDRYAGYMQKGNGGGELLTLAYCLMSAFFIYARKYIQKNLQEYDIYLLMFLCGTIIYAIVIFSGLYIEISRFAAYFNISAVFLWPMIFKGSLKSNRSIISVCFFIGHLIFMFIFYDRIGNLLPYMFNKSVFVN